MSRPSSALVPMGKGKEDDEEDDGFMKDVKLSEWFCHCCNKKNDGKATKCVVCGRGEDFANRGFPFPLHGYGAQIFRASQVEKVLPDVYASDESGWTPLHAVSSSGNLGLVQKLIKLESEIDAVTEHGETPLHLACFSGSLDCVKMLVEAGADIEARTYFEKKQAIHFACEHGWGNVVRYLMAHGSDVNSKNAAERTPLHYTGIVGRVDICADLLCAGADPEALDMGGWTARQMAELNNNREVVELLCRAGMTEKMPVIKELPPAAWHGKLWDSLTDSQAERRVAADKEKAQWAHLHDRLDRMRNDRLTRNGKK